MAIYVVALNYVHVKLIGDDRATITIRLPKDYDTNFIANAGDRRSLESLQRERPGWVRKRIKDILRDGEGVLADDDHPMRSPGAGVLPLLPGVSRGQPQRAVAHIRGSNRGAVWPLGVPIAYAMAWKEFAGVTGSPQELEDPRATAIMELYEELSFVSGNTLLLPADIDACPAGRALRLNVRRANQTYGFRLTTGKGSYAAVEATRLKGHPGTTVNILRPNGGKTTFKAIVNYDYFTNALEISFLVRLSLHAEVTGVLSLSGPENNDPNAAPFMEDVIVIGRGELENARLGEAVNAFHLLSVHGPMNYVRSPATTPFYLPAPTLVPIVAALRGRYSFRSVLARNLRRSPRS